MIPQVKLPYSRAYLVDSLISLASLLTSTRQRVIFATAASPSPIYIIDAVLLLIYNGSILVYTVQFTDASEVQL